MIRNKITDDFYIGSSVDIENRLSTHFNRDSRLYPTHPLYQAINTYEFEDFEFEILEICSPDEKIQKEQYWYDKLNPTYNMVRPTENNFIMKRLEKKQSKIQTLPNKYKNVKNYFIPKNIRNYLEIIQDIK